MQPVGSRQCAIVQLDQLADVLDCMERKLWAGQHAVEGPLAIAGHLCRADVMPVRNAFGVLDYPADVKCADTASIGQGSTLVQTVRGSRARGRTKCEHWVYIPFTRMNGEHNPCVLRVEQLLRIEMPGKGWDQGIAKIATGELHEAVIVPSAGCETTYNGDPAQGAVRLPTLLRVRRSAKPYKYAVYVHQIASSLVYARDSAAGMLFVTFSKMAEHG
jgi:hypothetical protein